MNAIILFIVCTAVNVILSTIKSIATIKGGKFVAALMNALTYGFYSWVIILTTTDGLSVGAKMLITAACNFIGVYLVKYFEEKWRKDRLWQITATVNMDKAAELVRRSEAENLIFNYIPIGKYCIINYYSYSKEDSEAVAPLLKEFEAKYFISEAKSISL